MGGDQHGGPLTGQLAQHGHHHPGKLGIQCRGRLVTEQHLGDGASARAMATPLLRPPGGWQAPPRPVPEPHLVEQLQGRATALLGYFNTVTNPSIRSPAPSCAGTAENSGTPCRSGWRRGPLHVFAVTDAWGKSRARCPSTAGCIGSLQQVHAAQRVLLPLPEGPIRAVTLPSAIARWIFFNTR